MPAEEDFKFLKELATGFFKLDDVAAEKFVNDGMAAKGYKPVQSWADPDTEGGKEKETSSFFGPKKSERESRSTDWQYPGSK